MKKGIISKFRFLRNIQSITSNKIQKIKINISMWRNIDETIIRYIQNELRNASLERIIQFVKLNVLISACYV